MRISFRNWFLAFRPKTLTAAVVPIVAATALAVNHDVVIRWWIPSFALIASICIQIATNLINDAEDFLRGVDTEARLGPRRVTQAGLATSDQVKRMGFLFFGIALLLGLPLVIEGGISILVIGSLSLLSGYAYTGGPYPLGYRGWGDLFVVIFFGLVAVSGLYFLLSGEWIFDALLLGLQVGLHCTVLIAINNLRDIESDGRSGRKTLPVRFGKTFARFEILFLLLGPFILNLHWWIQGTPWAAVLGFLVFPLAVILNRKVFALEPSPSYNQLLGKAALVHLGFGILTSIGLWIGK